VTNFLTPGGAASQRAQARAGFWRIGPAESSQLGIAATPAWVALVGGDGPGYTATGVDSIDAEVIASIDAAVRRGLRVTVTHGLRHSDGTLRLVEVSTWPLMGSHGESVATAAAVTDITEAGRTRRMVDRDDTLTGFSNGEPRVLATPVAPRGLSLR
jgi:hypothetical protein